MARFAAARFAWAALAALCLGGGRLQAEGAAPGEFELTPLTEQTLARLRTTSQEWVVAQESGAVANAEGAVKDLVATAQTLSFRRLPDAAVAAAWLAQRAAKRGDFAAAERALSMAETLDPGRPETSFAASAVARRRGSWGSAVAERFRGMRRLWDARPVGRLARHDLRVAALFALLLSAAGWVAILAGVHGPRLVAGMARSWERFLPFKVGMVLAVALLSFPILLRDGLGLAVVLWALALFTVVARQERVALALVLGVFCLAPWALSEIERRVVADASPGMRALDHLEAGRLSGTLFADLGALDAQLHDELAVKAIFADLHRRLGQWESARRLYAELAEAEPHDPSPILGLGAYHFAKNDFKRAVEQFLRAIEIDSRSVEAYFNLSQSYGSAYLFNDSRAALAQANAIAPDRVAAWVASPAPERLVVPDPVVTRRSEIEAALNARRAPATFGRLPLWALCVISWALLVAIGVAAAVALGRRARAPGAPTPAPYLAPFERLSPSWTAFLPGALSTARGRPFLGWLAWLPFGALISLGASSRWTPAFPAPLVSGSGLALVVAVGGLALWIGCRWAWASREED